MKPVTPYKRDATWGNDAGFEEFLVGILLPRFKTQVSGQREKRDSVKPNFLQIKSN